MRRLAALRHVVPHEVPAQLVVQETVPDLLADFLAHEDDPQARQVTVTFGDGSRRDATRDHVVTVQGTVLDTNLPPAEDWP